MKQILLSRRFPGALVMMLIAMSGAGCATMAESTRGDGTSEYVKTNNARGETVYRRERYVGPTSRPVATPVSTPVSNPVSILVPEPIRVMPAERPTEMEPAPSVVAAPSATVASERSSFGLGLELGSDGHRLHVGPMAMVEMGFVEARLGVSLFKGDNDSYAGFDAGVRPKLRLGLFSIFAGVGLYGGDSKRCETFNSIETCEKKFLYAGYGEVGVGYRGLSLFMRDYRVDEAGKQIPTNRFVGLGMQSTY